MFFLRKEKKNSVVQFFFNIVESAEKLLDPPYMITCMAHWRVQIYNYINIHTKILITYINTFIHSYIHTYTIHIHTNIHSINKDF